MELPRTCHLSLNIPQELLHCQSIWSWFDNFAATEHHQYHLEPVVLLNKSLLKSPLFGVVLIALGDSRGYRYRRPALQFGLLCFVIGFIFFTITWLHYSQISGPLKGALYRYYILFMCRQRQLDEATVSFSYSDQKTEKKPREYTECWISHCCRLQRLQIFQNYVD